jgi:hypothetical protein
MHSIGQYFKQLLAKTAVQFIGLKNPILSPYNFTHHYLTPKKLIINYLDNCIVWQLLINFANH